MNETQATSALQQLSVAQLSELTASDAPAPGGGAIAAMTGAFAAALACMMANLTLGKRNYEGVQDQMQAAVGELQALRQQLLDDMAADATAFQGFMAAMALPKDTEAQKAARSQQMQAALAQAAAVPLSVAKTAAQALPLCEQVVALGNRNVATDGLFAAMLARAAVRGALLNVRVNLASLKDQALAADLAAQCQALEAQAAAAEAAICQRYPEYAGLAAQA